MFNFIKNYIFTFVIFLIMFFSLGFFGCEYIYNQTNSVYVYSVVAEKNPEELLTVEFFEKSLQILDEENVAYANIDYEKMLESAYVNETVNGYDIVVKKSFFPNLVREKTGTINFSSNRCVKYLSLVFRNADFEINHTEIKTEKYINPFIAGSIGVGIGFITLISLIIISYHKDKQIKDISDNERIFKTPFHKKYFKYSKGFFKDVKSVCIISILFALMMVCKLLQKFIPSGFGNLGLGFTYLIFSVITMIYGPLCGIVIGLLSDILGFFMFDGNGIFFLGYTFDAMLAGFVYGLCFFRTKVTFTKCLTARIFVNFFINVFLGSIWWGIIYKLGFDEIITYVTVTSLPKNLLYLVPQSILLYLVLKALAKPISRFGLIEVEISDNISLF